MNRALPALSVAAFFVVAFTATAFAQGAVAPDDGAMGLVRMLWTALTGKQWWLGGALSVVLGVAMFKKYAPAGRARDFANSNAGAALLVLLGSFGGALVASLSGASAVPMSAGLAWQALQVAVGAAGGYSILKPFADMLLNSKWYADKAPAWLKAVVGMVSWIFTKTSSPGVAITRAEAAGDAAVAKNPPAGADGAAGKPTDV